MTIKRLQKNRNLFYQKEQGRISSLEIYFLWTVNSTLSWRRLLELLAIEFAGVKHENKVKLDEQEISRKHFP